MATNLLELARDVFSGERLQRLSNYLGENELQTRTALDGALPTVLGGMVQQSNQPNGVDRLLSLLRQNVSSADEGSFFDTLGERTTGDDEFRRMNSTGSSLLSTLFADKSSGIADALASYSGVSSGSATSLLSLGGSVLLGLLTRRLGTDGASAAGLTAFLSQQRDTVDAAMPSRLGSLLGEVPGLGLFSSSTGTATAGTATAAAAASLPRVDPVADVVGPKTTDGPVIEPRRASALRETRSGMGSWVPWVLLLAGIIALIYFLRSCGERTDTSALADSTRTEAADVASELDTAVTNAGDAIGNAADRLGAFAKRTLPGNIDLNIPERGIENRLTDFIESDKPVDKTTWFDFDRLLFDTGKATLRPESQEQLQNVANILKAYPNVNVKIGGYTDDQGDSEMNRRLSTDRAQSVVAELQRLGVAANRLEAEGYGETNPVASNETEEGRQQNRRISIRVTKK
jgi:outer membrane protein OmpA-like peptidoglycan-associated protein